MRRLTFIIVALLSVFILSCSSSEDPGPLQEMTQEFTEVDFDRIEMGDAFHVEIKQDNFFKISATGDRRNIEDLVVRKEGNTLIIRFNDYGNRKHQTYFTITLPKLVGANFSGATKSTISGFSGLDEFNLSLSGASVCQLDIESASVKFNISGASDLTAYGSSENMNAVVSGASKLRGSDYHVQQADLNVSGASQTKLIVTENLDAVVSGASSLTYYGDPIVDAEVTGGSSLHHE